MEKLKGFALRVSEDLYSQLKRIARQQERSVNGQINFVLKEWVEKYNAQEKK